MSQCLEQERVSGSFKFLAIGLIGARGLEGIPPDIKESLPHALEQGIITQKDIDVAQIQYKYIWGPIQELSMVRYVGLHQANKIVLAQGVAYGTLTHREIVEADEAYRSLVFKFA